MTSKLVVNTIEADTGISSVSFASSISMSSTSKFHFSAAGIDIGADTNINRPEAGVLGFNINGGEKARITSTGKVLIGTTSSSGSHKLEVNSGTDNEGIKVVSTDAGSYITFADNDTTGSTRIGAVDNDFKIDANSAERVRITSTGQFIVGTNPSVSSGNIVHIEAPTSFNSGETIVNIEGNNAAAAARIVLHNNNTCLLYTSPSPRD